MAHPKQAVAEGSSDANGSVNLTRFPTGTIAEVSCVSAA